MHLQRGKDSSKNLTGYFHLVQVNPVSLNYRRIFLSWGLHFFIETKLSDDKILYSLSQFKANSFWNSIFIICLLECLSLTDTTWLQSIDLFSCAKLRYFLNWNFSHVRQIYISNGYKLAHLKIWSQNFSCSFNKMDKFTLDTGVMLHDKSHDDFSWGWSNISKLLLVVY